MNRKVGRACLSAPKERCLKNGALGQTRPTGLWFMVPMSDYIGREAVHESFVFLRKRL
ncbi:MAG: hypothetical protein HY735_01625 [Verrucomicrobia bacterium]|nr:hypothetical protein [Verrucomicrobiota bacterium]